MAWTKYILWPLLCGMSIFALPIFAQETIDQDISRLKRLKQNTAEHVQNMAFLRTEVERLGKLIFDLKQKKSSTLIQNMSLEKHMQEAQRISKKLHTAEEDVQKSQDQFSSSKDALLSRIEKELALGSSHQRSHIQSLIAQYQMILSLGTVTNKTTPTPYQPVPIPKKLHKDVKFEQIIVLKDLAQYTETLIAQASSSLSKIKQRSMLQTELSHLMNEEVFFGEHSFIQVNPRMNALDEGKTIASNDQSDDSESVPSQDNLPEQETTGLPDQQVPESDTIPGSELDEGDLAGTGQLDPDLTEGQDPTLAVDIPQDIALPLESFEFDTKLQSLMQDQARLIVEPHNNDLQSHSPDATTSQGSPNPDVFFENPHFVTHAIQSFEQDHRESDQAFLQRKQAYLKFMLSNIERAIKRLETR